MAGDIEVEVDLSELGQGDVGPFLTVLEQEIDQAGDLQLARRVCTALKRHHIEPRKGLVKISLTGQQTEKEVRGILLTAFGAAMTRFRHLGDEARQITHSLEG